jgi:hypothetical protein
MNEQHTRRPPTPWQRVQIVGGDHFQYNSLEPVNASWLHRKISRIPIRISRKEPATFLNPKLNGFPAGSQRMKDFFRI